VIGRFLKVGYFFISLKLSIQVCLSLKFFDVTLPKLLQSKACAEIGGLTPKVLGVFFIKTASKQPLFKAR
jgi:hypothetical protein